MATEHERAFLREYLPAAWDRFDEHDAVEAVHFWRFGNAVDHDPPAELAQGVVLDDGGVILVVTGDPDPTPAVEAERDRWQRLREDGLLDSWTVEPWDGPHSNAREKIVDNLGSVGGDRSFRLRQVAAGTTVELLREFETDLPAVADATEDNPTGVGDWVLIHYLMKQNGHDWYDEIDACRKAIENRAWSLAAFYDHATARDAVETAIDELRAVHSELEEPDGSTPERPGSTPDGG